MPTQIPVSERPEFDRWILSCLNSLVQGVQQEMDGYDPTRAGRLIDAFVDEDLSNWYVRLNKKRFWGKEMDNDKLAAYQTLYECLMTVAKLLAPFAPFFADQLYKDLGGALDSVHLDKFPEFNAALVNKDLEERMSIAQRITTIVLSLRKKEGIAVKQPLQTLMIPPVDQAQAGILVKKVKCNFRTMGKKFGKDMKAVAAAVAEMTQEQIAELETNGKLQLGSYEILAEDVEIISEDIPGWLVGNDGNLTVALDITLTDELRAEGMARTLVNRIQNMRKKSGLEITDHIRVSIEPNEASTKAVEAFGDYIARQVLADDLKLEANDGQAVEFDDFKLNIQITKI